MDKITHENDFKSISNHWIKNDFKSINQIKIVRNDFKSKSYFI